ncbi:replication initiation protein [Fusobacterium sp. PH5-44]|uniref:replication initiation protein n=1 Tax=unclassified Fusobacterium TaxID=2648384 RepID=UPI003D1F2227
MKNKDINENKIVKYNNDLNKNILLSNLSSKEIDLFNAVCIKIRDTGDTITKISFDELKSLSNYTHKSKDRFISDINNACKKLLLANWSGKLPDNSRVGVTVFSSYKVDSLENAVFIKINEDFLHIFNNLKNNITVFNIDESNNIKSKYPKIQYRNFKENDIKGEYEEKYTEFREKMGITNMHTRDISSRVLKPIENELGKIFNNFQLIKEKKGKQIDKLKWVWTENKDDPFEFFNNIFKFINVNFTHKIQLKIHELQKEKSKEEIEELINKAWKLIKSNPKVKNPPAMLSKAITDIGLEIFINNIISNKESADREKKWAKEKQEYAKTSTESEEFYSQIFKSTETVKVTNATTEGSIQRENQNNISQYRREHPFFNDFQELPKEKQEEIFNNAKNIYVEKTGLELFGNLDNTLTIATLMPYIKEIMNNKQ